MAVSEKDVLHVASLARLAVDPARLPSLVEELNGILDHMEVLEAVDTSVEGQGSSVEGQGSSVEGQGSSVEGQGSSVERPGMSDEGRASSAERWGKSEERRAHSDESAAELRTDEHTPLPLEAPREAFAPEMRDGFFLVPRLATHEDQGNRAP